MVYKAAEMVYNQIQHSEKAPVFRDCLGTRKRREAPMTDAREPGMGDERTEKVSLRLPSELPAGFAVTASGGLSAAEAARRKENGQANVIHGETGKPIRRIITDNVFSFFNLLNFGLAACLLLVGSYRNLLFLGIVILNTMISIIQEIRAKRTIERLKLLNAPRVCVLRDGQEVTLTPEETVAGDLVVLRAGDQVVADAVVTEGSGSAMESLLTGESNPIRKEKDSWLYSGSYITEGKLTAQLVYVGDESYAGRLTEETRRAGRGRSGLMNEVERLIRWDTMVLVPLGILLLLDHYFLQDMDLKDAVPKAVAAMLGMIPEGLMLLTSVALAAGVVKLARKKVLVQELCGIETLARVDVLCLDKTGTITSGRMTLDRLVPVEADEEETRRQLSRFLGAFDERSSTLDVLRSVVKPGTEKPVAVLPFSSVRKKSAASFDDGKTLILGAPNFVLRDHYPDAVRAQAEALTGEGCRLVVLAEADGRVSADDAPEVRRILALIAIRDEIRPHAADTLRYFREEGVTIKVISGDDPRTVSRIARQAGIEGWDRFIDLTDIRTREELEEASGKYTVFGRVTPEQKKQLIQALHDRGHSVGMTGDGVNDIPAMKAADCSIAMAEGADAAKNSAQLTLLSSDFSVVPDILLEGRRVINNITRSASLFLTKTIFSLLLSLLSLLLRGAYPFEAIQMSLVSSLTVGGPGLFLALEPSRERIRGNFLRTVLFRALPGGLAITMCAAIAMQLTRWDMPMKECSSIAVWVAGMIGVVVLFRACVPLTRLRRMVVLGSLTGFIVVAACFGSIFLMVPLSVRGTAAAAALTLLGIGIVYGSAYLIRKRQAGRKPERTAA